ncbi:hypothetical protein OEA41_005961 [Lepraria neglecta]|uniref:Uncharacterized protein n=1 Tax=Lepraria neglecta TaxID=209136 RepID=A0AAD9Z9H7_9LECA|nr:hypothetical protein OEA41_005961 [Lepraria neglecta]
MHSKNIAGSRERALPTELLWESQVCQANGARTYRPKRYRAPSWSWASIEGEISMEKRAISTYLQTKPIHIEVLSTSYYALDNYIDDQDYATQVQYGSIRLKGGLVNSRVRECWSGLSVDPYSPGNEDKNYARVTWRLQSMIPSVKPRMGPNDKIKMLTGTTPSGSSRSKTRREHEANTKRKGDWSGGAKGGGDMGKEKRGVCGSEVERVDEQEQLLNKNADWVVKKAVKKSVSLSMDLTRY